MPSGRLGKGAPHWDKGGVKEETLRLLGKERNIMQEGASTRENEDV